MKKLMVLIMAAAVLIIPANVFASGGGNGTGGGKNEGLYVESASIEDGAVLVSGEAITLVFSKNVVNSKVAGDNAALFQVLDGSQAEVAIEVSMADDQVEPDKKNDVVIQFPQGLADGTYTLTAKQGITSKSGDVMEKDYTLTFRAGGQTSGEDTKQTTEQAADQTAGQTPEQTSKQAMEQTAGQTPEPTSEQAADQTTGQTPAQAPETAAVAKPEGNNMLPVIIVVVILAAAGGFMILRKKK